MPPQTTGWLTRVQLGLAAIALLMLFFIVPLALTGDGHGRWEALTTSLGSGRVQELRYSYVGPLFAAPFLLFDSRQTEVWWAMRFNVLLLAAGAAAAWWTLRGVAAPAARASFILLLAAGGMMPFHVRNFYGEVFSAVSIGAGLLLVVGKAQPAGWIAAVLGVANMPASAPAFLLVALWRIARTRRYDGLIALACAVALILAENAIVRGDPFTTGYAGDRGHRTVMPFSGRPGFSYPLFLGIVSLLFSFGKGVLFFAPGLLMIPYACRHASRAIAETLEAWTIFLGGLVLAYSQWWAWYGGWYWGPRFLLFAAFPSALALAIAITTGSSRARSIAAAVLVAWTIWVGVSGAVFGLHGMDVCMANDYALEHLCWYAPEFSPLFRPLVIRPSLNAAEGAWLVLAAAALTALVLPSLWRTADASPEPETLKRFPPSESS